MPIGKSLLLAAVHRAIKPGSKNTFAARAKQTTLPEIAGFDPDKLDSRHFWEQMDTVNDEQFVDRLYLNGLLDQRETEETGIVVGMGQCANA
ncbi:hypothetical protein [Desulforamulus profundi]|uniref:hypothetical protein n=1 Tax=Desulforamulus profundi TaxID=1383067 RepID=UPI0011781B44|nr:hypothetical protein [Desulforamulus profundi]